MEDRVDARTLIFNFCSAASRCHVDRIDSHSHTHSTKGPQRMSFLVPAVRQNTVGKDPSQGKNCKKTVIVVYTSSLFIPRGKTSFWNHIIISFTAVNFIR
jgi:hypothetical protein